MVICDTPKNIRMQLPGELIELFPEDWGTTLAFVRTQPGVLEVQTYGESLHLIVDSGKKRLMQIERSLKKQELGYRSARIAPIRMEEAFISLIQRMESANGQHKKLPNKRSQ
jgi:hypothetical protein